MTLIGLEAALLGELTSSILPYAAASSSFWSWLLAEFDRSKKLLFFT